ncbi:MAG: hypothetical protein D6785_05465 [Planctomycetota bacterium]|nr:MAG: hypothetical protein D6785_05465 [Planctomycetota bacterium]
MEEKEWKPLFLEVILNGLASLSLEKQKAKAFLRKGLEKGLWDEEEKDYLFEELYLKQRKDWDRPFEKRLKEQMKEYLEILQLPSQKDILELNLYLKELLDLKKDKT